MRCPWANPKNELYLSYHDEEWGVPVHDDRRLFEKLVLEGAQAGLSWLTILKKRAGYRKAFDRFDVDRVARYGQKRIERLLGDPGIVRNRRKIESAVRNAQGVLRIQEEFGSLDAFLWKYVDFEPRQNRWKKISRIPARTKESDAMSRDLKMRGFSFVGPTICYAFMQSMGMVNDHTTNCFRYKELEAYRRT